MFSIGNMKIGARLVWLVSVLLGTLILIGVIALRVTGESNAALQSSYQNRLEPTGTIGKVMMLMNENRGQVMLGLQHNPDNPLSKMHDHPLTMHTDVIVKNRDEISAAWQEYQKHGLSPEEKVLANKYTDSRAKYVSEGLMPAREALLAGDFLKANEILLKKLNPAYTAANASANVLLEFILKSARNEHQTSIDAYGTARIIVISTIVLGLLFGLGFAVWIIRSITRPLAQAVDVAQRVAAGDLTSAIEVKTKDETGMLLRALKDMNESLKKIVGEVRSGAEAIGSGTKQIASGNADLSQRTEEQASSLEETASSMEELTSTVKQNAENAKQANQLAVSASEVAVKGGSVVSEVVGTMSSINDSSKKIVDIISVIDGIAFQTNILALNAAVEAARAGEQGRGFAVVASEVRSLAQRSAAAAKEIKGLIGDSVDKVGAGTKLVDEAGKTMQEIVASVKRVTDIMSEITAASQEQSSGIEQVNQAITQMDEVTQQNAALVEEAAAAAESLEEQAQNLEATVAVFKLGQDTMDTPALMAKAERPVASVSKFPARKAAARAAVARAAEKPALRKIANGRDGNGEWAEF